MRYLLVDIPDRENFYPFTLTRSLATCRVGIFTFKERWEQYVKEEVTREALEDNIDLPTVYAVIDAASGIQLTDPTALLTSK